MRKSDIGRYAIRVRLANGEKLPLKNLVFFKLVADQPHTAPPIDCYSGLGYFYAQIRGSKRYQADAIPLDYLSIEKLV